ncbi:armadillo-type protein [Scheffersomyces xylosifermentans]|uniref:armadillo-type protein n=1 Tax=Scheffersomyces xylosifermentans TaxID=1304137 RepID=UPI00315D8242
MSEKLDEHRNELRALNERAWNGESVYSTAGKLDSSLKKNTTFIKKIRTSINAEQYGAILKEIQTVSLEKYLSEIITSLSEVLFKVSRSDDILAAIEIVSALHQRFASLFTPYLLVNLLVGVANPNRSQSQNHITESDKEKEELARISRQKNLLRLIEEFSLIGVFRTLKDCNRESIPDEILRKFAKQAGEPIAIVVLKDILNFEIRSGASLSIAQAFLKRFHHIIYDENNTLINSDHRTLLQQIFKIYTEAVFDIQVDTHKKVQRLIERNKKASIRTGRILEENTIELEEYQQLLEKFVTVGEYLSTVVGLKPPVLTNEESLNEAESVVEVVKQKSLNEDDLGGIWEDIKEKNFYTKIPTLAELAEEFDTTEALHSKDGEKIESFLLNFERLGDIDVEKLVIEFNSLKLNNKATRNRLLRFFIESPDMSVLRYYTRFLKINEENLKEVIAELIEYLDKGFRSQIYHNKLNFKNIYFFVELIKFKMVPTHVIFHKIRSLTLNITSTNNLDILSVFYEHVGRFLLNEPEYRELMLEMIALLKEKKKGQNLTINDKSAINNLLIIIDPPVTKVLNLQGQQPERIIRVELNSKTAPIVASELKKFDLKNDKKSLQQAIECFSSPESLNYDNIPALAQVLEKVSRKNKSLLTTTIDTMIEKVIPRMAHIKYIAELYNNKLLNFKFLNDMLYKIVQPLPGNYKIPTDLPDNYFRIQLCSESSRPKRKASKAKSLLKNFLIFLQYYTYCKEQPIPMELEFRLNDVLVKFGDLWESVSRLQEVAEKNKKLRQDETYSEVFEEDDEDDEDDDEDEEDDEDDYYEYDDEDDDDDEDDEDDDEDEEDDEDGLAVSDDSEEDTEEGDDSDDELTDPIEPQLSEKERLRIAEDKKFAADLEEEFQKILQDSYETNRTNPVTARSKFNVPIPSRSQLSTSEPVNSTGKIAFSLMTKSGKKTNMKQLNLPTDNKFAESLLKEKAHQQEHKERIMNLVMGMKD